VTGTPPDAAPGAAPAMPAPELRIEARETPEFRFSAAEEPRLIAGVLPRRMSPPRSSRFILLAACVGLSACVGAAAGTASLLALEHPSAPPSPLPSAPAQPVRMESSDEMRALKDTVGQLRSHLKSLDASVGTLRSTLNGTSSATAGQLAKITDMVERINRVQSERVQSERIRSEHREAERPTERVLNESSQAERTLTERNPAERHVSPGSAGASPPAAPDAAGATVTGAVGPVAEAKAGPAVIEGWVLRKAREGAALIEGRYGTIEIEPGDYLPGIGRVEEIKREGGRWVVVTPKGLIVSAR
jgi:hypothetical protein